jgi:hypothetical protein
MHDSEPPSLRRAVASTARPGTPARGPTGPATRQLVLTLWCARAGEFAARAVLADGSVRDFDNPFELLRFISTPVLPPAAPAPSGSASRGEPGLR